MQEFEKRLHFWDGVLLDAKMFDQSVYEADSLTGLQKAVNKIESLRLKRYVPYFIYTAQPDLLDNRTFAEIYGKFYDKTDAEAEDRLVDDIKEAADHLEERQIRSRLYAPDFDAIESLDLPTESESIFMEIYQAMHFPGNHKDFNPAHHYNQLRQLIEYVFRHCNQYGLVPDECIPNGIVNLNQSSLYLAGHKLGILKIQYCGPDSRIVPFEIECMIRQILDFGNLKSHTAILSEQDKVWVESYFRTHRSPYIIFGLTHCAAEIILWLADYLSNEVNRDRSLNLSYKKRFENDGPVYSTSKDFTPTIGEEYFPVMDENNIWHIGDSIISPKRIKAQPVKILALEELRTSNPKISENYKFSTRL